MSNAVFPAAAATIPGLSWSVTQEPTFSTITQRAISGKELRAALMQYALWNISLTYDVLRDADYGAFAELETLSGFFLSRQGSFDSFLWTNPNDKTSTGNAMGTGNGTNLTFQLARQRGGGGFTVNEPVNNVNALTSITFNGVTQNSANYSTSANGLVTFTSNSTTAANSVLVAWTGTFYYRTRFTQDSAEFNNFMRGLWELRKLELVGSVVNKV